MKTQKLIFLIRHFKFCHIKFLLWGIVFLLASCKDDSSVGIKYDSSQPIELTSFMPDSGGIRTKFIVEGSNFGTEDSIVKVLFSEDEKEATVIGVNNERIYCLVPKESGGDNIVKVVVDEDTVSFGEDNTFKYTVAENVSTIVGVSGEGGSDDGILSDGRVQRTFGIAAVEGGDLLTFETYSGTVRYIAIEDNAISTIQTGFYGGQPAISQDRQTLYSIGYSAGEHKVYKYTYENLWEPEIVVSGISESTTSIFSCALDDTEEWLYFRDVAGQFGRLEIANPSNVEILNTDVGTVSSGNYVYLTYSPVDDCFFLAVQSTQGIYKISKDGQTIDEYIGFNGLGTTNAQREDCKLYNPVGVTVDSEGNLYWCDSSSFTIRKFNRKSEYVSTIAGIAGTAGGDNGEPLESSFSYPYCMNADEEDNFFIGESWGCTIRELAIE